jgi:hypothetical protein
MSSWSSLYLDWSNGMTDYIARHVANYSRIQTCLDYLYALTGGGRTMLDVPLGLQQIFDRAGIVGKGSYKPVAATLSGPNYNLTVAAGAYWNTMAFYMKATTTAISMSGQSSGTLYINIDAAGNPSVGAHNDTSVWQFTWNSSTHVVSAVTKHAGIAILFDGDDYADSLTSAVFGLTFESIADRFEYLEGALGGISDHLAYDSATSTGLNFHYNAGRVRNDNVVWEVVAGYVSLVNNDVNYVEVDPADGVVYANVVGFTTLLVPLYEVTTSGGAITVVSDKRSWLGAGGGGGGGGGGHTQNTDTGTTAAQFKLNMSVVGAPSADAKFAVERGTSPDVAVRWNETIDKWQYTEDGSNWLNLGDVNIDLGAQEISKYVPVDYPEKVFEEVNRSSTEEGLFEEIDLTSFLVDTPDGIDAAVFRVVFWDEENPPSVTTNVRFRKAGSGMDPLFAYTLYSPELLDWSRPQTLVLGVSTDNKIEFNVTASGSNTASLRVYLVGWFKRILGVGTQNVNFASSGLEVADDSTVDFNLENFANRALVHYFKIAETGGLVSGDYDVEVYANDSFDVAGLLYKAVGIHPNQDYEDWLPWWHSDGDGSKELHIRIINKDLTQIATFDIIVRCEMFA